MTSTPRVSLREACEYAEAMLRDGGTFPIKGATWKVLYQALQEAPSERDTIPTPAAQEKSAVTASGAKNTADTYREPVAAGFSSNKQGTPRTDEEARSCAVWENGVLEDGMVRASFARQLERELAEAKDRYYRLGQAAQREFDADMDRSGLASSASGEADARHALKDLIWACLLSAEGDFYKCSACGNAGPLHTMWGDLTGHAELCAVAVALKRSQYVNCLSPK